MIRRRYSIAGSFAVVALAAVSIGLFRVQEFSVEAPGPVAAPLQLTEASHTVEYQPELRLDVYLPDEEEHPKPWPTVLVFHGGSWAVGNRVSPTAVSIASILREHGYAAISAEYRLTSAGYSFTDQLEDILAAHEWTVREADRFGFDVYRMGTAGFSAGGHLASLLAMLKARQGPDDDKPGAVHAFFSTGGIYDLDQLFEQAGEKREEGQGAGKVGESEPPLAEAAINLMEGDPSENPLLYAIASPDDLAEEMPEARTPPAALVMAGRRDPIVPVEQAREFAETLRRKGGEVTFIETDSVHLANVTEATEEGDLLVVEFFDEHLKNRHIPSVKR